MQQSWRQIVLRSPPALVVAAVAACSVGLSVAALFALTAGLRLGFGGDFPAYVAIAVVIPLLVSVPVSGVIVHLLHEVEDARQAAQRLAWQDELTGLNNRRRFIELAQREVDLARRNGQPVVAVLMDLDDFKLVNDGHGHAVGDRMLVAVADAVAAALRSTDLAGRWGGEEFALVLPGTDIDDGLLVMERVLQMVRALRVTGAEQLPIGCTASIGLAVLRPDMVRVEALIDQADRAMYAAKTAGKNRVAPAQARLPA
jgi:diguanylate cyclase (GGDEF)-like protein